MPLPADDPRQRRPDISKANELFAWKPTVPLQDGLLKTIVYFERLFEGQSVNA
jgi:UDP-glucuronate decarboxylase